LASIRRPQYNHHISPFSEQELLPKQMATYQ
jgi:hypothetical protein